MGSGCSAPTPTSPSSRASPSASPSSASTSWATASAIFWTRARGSGDDAVTTPDAPLLAVQDLAVSFATLRGRMRVLDGVGFDVARGEVLGLVGARATPCRGHAASPPRPVPPPGPGACPASPGRRSSAPAAAGGGGGGGATVGGG